jgi:hypothetical protein
MQLTSGPWVRGRPRGALYRPHPLFPAATSPRGIPRAARFRFHEYSTRIRNIFKSKGVLAMD